MNRKLTLLVAGAILPTLLGLIVLADTYGTPAERREAVEQEAERQRKSEAMAAELTATVCEGGKCYEVPDVQAMASSPVEITGSPEAVEYAEQAIDEKIARDQKAGGLNIVINPRVRPYYPRWYFGKNVAKRRAARQASGSYGASAYESSGSYGSSPGLLQRIRQRRQERIQRRQMRRAARRTSGSYGASSYGASGSYGASPYQAEPPATNPPAADTAKVKYGDTSMVAWHERKRG